MHVPCENVAMINAYQAVFSLACFCKAQRLAVFLSALPLFSAPCPFSQRLAPFLSALPLFSAPCPFSQRLAPFLSALPLFSALAPILSALPLFSAACPFSQRLALPFCERAKTLYFKLPSLKPYIVAVVIKCLTRSATIVALRYGFWFGLVLAS